MSDADDQMGGSGGETGLDPRKVRPGKDNAAPVDPDKKHPKEEDDDSEDD